MLSQMAAVYSVRKAVKHKKQIARRPVNWPNVLFI